MGIAASQNIPVASKDRDPPLPDRSRVERSLDSIRTLYPDDILFFARETLMSRSSSSEKATIALMPFAMKYWKERKRWRFVPCCFLFVTCVFICHAQYRATNWNADPGLPQNSVHGIVQTPDGYLWIATLNGVARFDGIRFVVFDRSNTEGIGANRFTSMIQDSSGALWLVSEGGNIVRYQNGKFQTLGLAEGVRPLSVAGVTTDNRGGVWIVSDGVIRRWSDTAKHFQQEAAAPTGVWFTTLWWTGTGFWGLKAGKLYCFVHGKLSVHDIPKSLSAAKFKDAAIEEDGTLWISLPGDRLAMISSRNVTISSTPVERSFTDKSGRQWEMRIAPNLDRTLLFSVGGRTEEISYNIINEDNESNLWVGAEGRGLFRIQKQSVMVYSKAQGLVGGNIYPVFKSSNGSIWVGTWPAGLSQIRDGRVVTYTQRDGVPGPVTALAEDAKGRLWVGTHGGLRLLTQGRLHIPTELPASELPTVQAILQTRDGSMMLATQHGVYVLEGSGSHWLTSKNGLATDDARVLIQSRNGDIWIGGYGGLTRIHNGMMQRWTEQDGLPSNTVRAIYEDEAGDLWIGTYDGGLGRLRGGRWTTFNTKTGLFDNGVFQILEDSHSNFWMSSNRGISRVPKEQLNEVAADDGCVWNPSPTVRAMACSA